MKKTTLMAILLLFAHAISAQEGTTYLGFNLGFTEPTEYYRANGLSDNLSKFVMNGVKVGFIYETNIIKGFGVSMSLNYAFAAHAGKYEAATGMTAYTTREDRTFHYLELPVDWQYKFLIAKHTYLAVYTGPTLQVGLSYAQRNRSKLGETIITDDRVNLYKVDEDHDDIIDRNRLNVTWGVGLGLQYKRFFIRGGYDFGIMPMYRDRFFNYSANDGWNRKGRLDQWQIKLGIYLWELQ